MLIGWLVGINRGARKCRARTEFVDHVCTWPSSAETQTVSAHEGLHIPSYT